MKKALMLSIVLMAVGLAATAGAKGYEYMLSRIYSGMPKGKVAAGLSTGFGLRTTRPFGEEGFEQRLNFNFGITDWLKAKAEYGFGWKRGGVPLGGLVNANLRFRILRSKKQYIDLTVAGGYVFDYTKTHIATLQIVLGRNFGNFDLIGSTRLEFPFDSKRDPVDLIITLAASYGLSKKFRIGFEVAAEDLEGFWEEEEAEGGARFILGPSLVYRILPSLRLSLGLALIIRATRNKTPYATTVDQGRFGVISRLECQYTF